MLWGAGNWIWRHWSQFLSENNVIVFRKAAHAFIFIPNEQIAISCLAYVSRPRSASAFPPLQRFMAAGGMQHLSAGCGRNKEA